MQINFHTDNQCRTFTEIQEAHAGGGAAPSVPVGSMDSSIPITPGFEGQSYDGGFAPVSQDVKRHGPALPDVPALDAGPAPRSEDAALPAPAVTDVPGLDGGHAPPP